MILFVVAMISAAFGLVIGMCLRIDPPSTRAATPYRCVYCGMTINGASPVLACDDCVESGVVA